MRTAALALGLAIALVPAAALATPPVAPPASGAAPAVVRPALAGSALLTAVQTRSAQVEAAGETLSEQDAELSDLRRDLSGRTQELATLDQDLTAAQQVTDDWARTAFMSTGEFSPLPDLASSASPAANLARLKAGVAAARQVYLAGAAKEGPFAAGVAANHAKYDKAVADLVALQTANAAQLATDSQAMDQRRLQAGSRILRGLGERNVLGQAPGPAALKALQYAYAQLGKPYEWGAEGPDTFDCSGLVQSAYASAGIRLPRTARPQWRATTPIPVGQLVPGDLMFFATNANNWNTIHHVAFYIGHGEMLHAPTTGDVVKISPVWWEEFFGATRVVPAVDGPAPGPLPSVPATHGPSPRPSAPASPPTSPKPSPQPSQPSPKPSSSGPAGGGSPSPAPSPESAPVNASPPAVEPSLTALP